MAETQPNRYDSRYVQHGRGGAWVIAAVIAIVLILGALAWMSGGPSTTSSSLETTAPATGTQDEMAPAAPDTDTMTPAAPDQTPAGN